MPRLILKSPYMKPGSRSHRKNYVEYMAIREGVELPKGEEGLQPVTVKQDEILRELVEKYPDVRELFEYDDFRSAPNQRNAGALMSAIADCHPEEFSSRKGYVSYMATRPGVEKISSHGLFSSSETQPDIAAVQAEVETCKGNIWTHIISLRREDAARLGFDSVKAWQDLLRSNQYQIAAAMRIAPENFRWYAAFHNVGSHPHVHMLAFSTDPKEAYLSRQGIQKIKSVLANDIFRNDLISIYKEQTVSRDRLRAESRAAVEEAVERINRGVPADPLMEQMLLDLSRRLKRTKGKKVYGYLPAGTKKLVNAIVDRLAENPDIHTLYEEWYKLKNEVLRTYQDSLPEQVPLSQRKEFRAIRNAVVAAALNIQVPAPGAEETALPGVSSLLVSLFYQASRIFQNRIAGLPASAKLDSKERQKLMEKKAAQGQKCEAVRDTDENEEQSWGQKL